MIATQSFIPKNWHTTIQAARILNYAPGTLANKRVTGDGPEFIKFGGTVYYSSEAIEAYIKTKACTYRSTYEWKKDER